MSINLIDLLTEAKEVKIYLQPGQKAPKGKKVQKGPKGGKYFLGTPAEKQAHDKGKSNTKITKPAVNIFDKPKDKVNKNKINLMGEPANLPKGMKIGSYLEPYSFQSRSTPAPVYRVDSIDNDKGIVYFTKFDDKGKPVKKLKKTFAAVDNGMLTVVRKPRIMK